MRYLPMNNQRWNRRPPLDRWPQEAAVVYPHATYYPPQIPTQSPYQGFLPLGQPPNNGQFYHPNPLPYQYHQYGNLSAPDIFQNPLQQAKKLPMDKGVYEQLYHSQVNPYPKPNYPPKSASGGLSSVMNSFKTQDGTLDFNKMANTAGQMMNAVTQVSSVFKGIGGLFKS